MSDSAFVKGGIPAIIRNDANLYEGDLRHYFQTIFYYAKNNNHPYHNFRHMLHVTWLCHEACFFYRSELSKRQMRNLLIAALFHDFDHRGQQGNDDLNINQAIIGLHMYLLGADRKYFDEISDLIRATEYPPVVHTFALSLSAQILCDADLSQALDPAWIQQVVFGLAAEWKKAPFDVLSIEGPFHKNLKFHTRWARSRFTPTDLEKKIQEIQELTELLKIDVAA